MTTAELENHEVTLTGLPGKVALITGAGRMRSLGREFADAFARAGCDVVITGSGRSPDSYPDDEKAAGWRDIESVADEVRSHGVRALPVVCDATDFAQVEALRDKVLSEFGHLDILVNNAGAPRGEDRKPLFDVEPDIWRRVIEVNLVGSFYACKVLGPLIVEGGPGGCIINISSVAGKTLRPGASAYVASKAGLQGMSASLAGELGPKGIRVNAICVGMVDTNRVDDLGRGETWEKMIRRLIPLRRAGEVTDISNVVLFLCSDQGAWITGQSMNVDGGHVVWH